MKDSDTTAAAPMSKQDPDRMGKEPIGRLIAEFSIPAIISMVFSALYNVVDSIFLGIAVPMTGLAVMTLALPIQMILMGLSGLAGQGGNALAAIFLGEGKRKEAENILGNTTLLLIIIAILAAVLSLVFMEPMLRLIGTTDSLMEPTRQFLDIVCALNIFSSLGMGLNHFLRTAGRPNLALFTGMLGTLACIAFNALFVLVLGWGISGSAWATIAGQTVGMVPVLWFLIFNKKSPFNLRLKKMSPRPRLMGRILVMGLASFLMQAASTLVGVVLNRLLGYYGAMIPMGADAALSTIGTVQKIGWFVITPLFGLIMGVQPLIGYNYGAKNFDRVLKVLKLGIIWACLLGLVCWILVMFGAEMLVSLFNVEQDLIPFTAKAQRIYCLFLPIVGFQIMGSSYFQSSGQPIKSAILELTRQVIFLMPLYVVLPHILPQLFNVTGLDSLVIAGPCSDALAIIVTAVFVVIEVRRLLKRIKEQKAQA